MALISATDTFDEEELEPTVAEDLEPLITWLNENMQNIVAALNGGIGDKNLTTRNITVKATSGIRQFVAVDGEVSDVQISRLVSQPDANVLISGYNWWPSTNGFEFLCTWEGDLKTREVVLRISFNV